MTLLACTPAQLAGDHRGTGHRPGSPAQQSRDALGLPGTGNLLQARPAPVGGGRGLCLPHPDAGRAPPCSLPSRGRGPRPEASEAAGRNPLSRAHQVAEVARQHLLVTKTIQPQKQCPFQKPTHGSL